MIDTLSLLIIDDDAIDRTQVRRSLRTTGVAIDFTEATDADDALALLTSRVFDCILLDYQIAGLDGLTMLRRMRERGIQTPVVMLTGHGDEELAVTMLKSGAADYLVKGAVSPDRLLQSIRSAIRVGRAEQGAMAAKTALRASVARLRFLADASTLLGASLDIELLLASLGELIVPQLADWCAIDVLDSKQVLRRSVSVGFSRLTPEENTELESLFALEGVTVGGPPEVIRTLQPIGHPALPDANHLPPPQGQAERWRAVDGRGLLVVPMVNRGRALGAITFVVSSSGRVYTADDLSLALDLCRRAAAALDNAHLYTTAQDAIRLRDDFLSVASHELKTPLTSMYGSAQLLERRLVRSGMLDERDQRTLRVVIDQGARLNKMISSLLDITRLQNSQLSVQLAPLDLRQFLERLADEIRPTLEQHTLRLELPDAPVMVAADELRIHQVMQNLVGNAVKYSPEGGEVCIALTSAAGNAQIDIGDSGMGIPTEALPHLFSQFYRADNAQQRAISGIGLGLYVVHQIVGLHGGSVAAQSTEGIGSVFTVRLPLVVQSGA